MARYHSHSGGLVTTQVGSTRRFSLMKLDPNVLFAWVAGNTVVTGKIRTG